MNFKKYKMFSKKKVEWVPHYFCHMISVSKSVMVPNLKKIGERKKLQKFRGEYFYEISRIWKRWNRKINDKL